jgi:RHS repeat-associated protein
LKIKNLQHQNWAKTLFSDSLLDKGDGQHGRVMMRRIIYAALAITLGSVPVTARGSETVVPVEPGASKPAAVLSSGVTREELIGVEAPAVSTSSTPVTMKGSFALALSSASSGGSITGGTAPEKAIHNFQLDQFSGAGAFQYPIALPPGRAGVQPAVVLSYSPRGGNGPLGQGWSLDFGAIELSGKNGVPKYNSTDTFISTLGGGAQELVDIGNKQYRAKIEGAFITYTFDGQRWSAQDKQGNTYYFGLDNVLNDASRVTDPGGSGRVYRWRLSQVKDPQGNYYFIRYASDGGVDIHYTGEPGTDRHTFGAASQKFAVKVSARMEEAGRPDPWSGYQSGFAISSPKRISRVVVEAGGALYREYVLGYETSRRTGRSLLAAITVFGADGASALPAITFTYTGEDAPDYRSAAILNDPTQGNNRWNYRVDESYEHGHEVYGYCPPSDMCKGVNWGATNYGVTGGSWGGGSMSVSGTGRLYFNSKQDVALHFWTYLYVKEAVTVSVPFKCRECNAGVWINGDYSTAHRYSWPLKKGYNLVEITAYHQHQSISMDLNVNLSGLASLMDSSQVLLPQLAGDFNGDGRGDVATYYNHVGDIKVALSTGESFGAKSQWIPGPWKNRPPLPGDFNADGRTDIVTFDAATGQWRVIFSDGTKFADQGFWISSFGDNGSRPGVMDFDGDGRADIMVYYAEGGQLKARVARNTGAAFTPHISGITVASSDKAAAFTADFNGDGLPDFGAFRKDAGTWEFRINDGKDGHLRLADVTGFGQNRNMVVADFDADGRSDIGYYDYPSGKIIFRTFAGEGFGPARELAAVFNLKEADAQVQAADFNGNGLSDYAVYNELGNLEIAYASGDPADLLRIVDNGIGGSTAIEYQPSTDFDHAFMPFSLPVISAITLASTRGDEYRGSYSYSGGLWDSETREFRGFKTVRALDPDGNYVETGFLQGRFTKGRVSRMTFTDGAARKLVNEQRLAWEEQDLGNGARFVYLKRLDGFVYDGAPEDQGRRSAVEFTYGESPQYGNLTRELQLGEVDLATGADTGTDSRGVETGYAHNPAAHILGLPRRVAVKNHPGQTVRQTWFDYDGLANGAPPVKGLLTGRRQWAGDGQDDIVTKYSYDLYGNLVEAVDPGQNTTKITYDSRYNMFPVATVNALGHEVATTYYGVNSPEEDGYSGLWGQVKSGKDPNGREVKRSYDAFGRPVLSVGPLDSREFPSEEIEYSLRDGYFVITSSRRVERGRPGVVSVHEFVDGLGRVIQVKSPDRTAGRHVVSGLAEYDHKGRPRTRYLPFFSTRPALEPEPVDPARPGTQMFYDAAGRVVRQVNPDGTYSTAEYDRWTARNIDANGHKQEADFDARGRLVERREYTGADGRFAPVYPAENYRLYAATRYGYDSEGNLTQTVDAHNNVTEIVYDALGRKREMGDPDMGRWTYEYDASGNLVEQTDAKGDTIAFEYDVLNRLTRKSDRRALDVAYTYDDPFVTDNARGRLTRARYGAEQTGFSYDALGRETQSTKNIDGRDFSVQRSYDALDRLTDVVYPDGEKAYYRYNAAGQIEGVSNSPAEWEDSKLDAGIHPGPARDSVLANFARLFEEYILGVRPAHAATDYTSDPECQAAYRFEGDARDSCANGRDGTVHNAVPADGKFGQAYHFNGDDSHIKIGTFDPSSGDLSLVMWVKWKGGNGRNQGIISKRNQWNSATHNRWEWSMYSWNKTTFGQYGSRQYFNYWFPPADEWTHWALVHKAGESTKIYVDGRLAETRGAVVFGDSTAAEILIGSIEVASTQYAFNGAIDEVGIFSKVLSEAEINAIKDHGLDGSGGSDPEPDTTPPSVPSGLNATAVWQLAVNLAWNGSIDNAGVTGYKIYRDGVEVAIVEGATYADTGLTPATQYSYTVAALDAAGNASAQSAAVLATTSALSGGGTGEITREVWLNISGTTLSSLTGNSRYPDSPSSRDTLSSFEALVNWADNYGTRVLGYIHPPVTGLYEFWIASDDDSRLFLSSDDQPDNKQQIASVAGWTNPRQWTKYASQKSTLINLTAGQKYYIEALHKEGKSGDHLAVAWKVPGGSLGVIPGSYLSPYSPELPPEPEPDTALPSVPTELTAAVLEAENMATKTTGGSVSDGWNIWASGYIQDTVSILSSGEYTVVVRAKGELAGSALPRMGLRIDNTLVAYQDVGATQWTDYTFTVNLQAGTRSVGAQFMNDYYALPLDRNLLVDKITILRISGPEPDTAPPSVPSGLNAAAMSSSRIDLSWNASTDNVGVSGYKIYRDGALITTAAGTTCSDTGLSSGTTHAYTVASYDEAGNVSEPSSASLATTRPPPVTVYVRDVEYNVLGQAVKVELGNGTVTESEYNPLNARLTRQTTMSASGEILQDLLYTYDAVGNILEIIDNVNTASQTFEYDALGRLRKAENPSTYGVRTYAYDEIGNIMEKDGRAYTYGEGNAGPHAVTRVTGNGYSATFTYDANGNMETKQEGSVLTTYSYDAENRLVKVKKGNDTLAEFEYDGDGGRTRKVSGGRSVSFTGGLFETGGGGGTGHVFFGGARVASVTGGEVLYYHPDHLGGVNVVTDAAGAKVEVVEYDPFGAKSRHDRYGAAEDAARHYFTGQYKDPETGLYFFQARYYDPELGRFLTPDTIVQDPTNPQTLNRYSYAGNNPVNNVDPTGHSWKNFWKAAVGAFIGAAITVLTAGAGAPLWVAGMAGGFFGGAVTGGLEGGWKGALYGGLIGGALGGIGGWGGGIAQAHNMGGWYTGSLLAAGTGMAGATDSWDSFAGGFVGGILGGSMANGYLSVKNDGLSEAGPTKGIRAGVSAEDNENWAFLGAGTTDDGAGTFANENQMTVIYSKSRGLLSDLFRAGFKKIGVSGPYARQSANYMNVAEGKFILAHSEGTLNLGAGIRLSAAGGLKFNDVTIKWIGPVMSESTAYNLSNSIGAQSKYILNAGDPIGVFSTFNPVQSAIYGGVGLATMTRYHSTNAYVR